MAAIGHDSAGGANRDDISAASVSGGNVEIGHGGARRPRRVAEQINRPIRAAGEDREVRIFGPGEGHQTRRRGVVATVIGVDAEGLAQLAHQNRHFFFLVSRADETEFSNKKGAKDTKVRVPQIKISKNGRTVRCAVNIYFARSAAD